MSHPDPTVLAMAALGERIHQADASHIESCLTCSVDAQELRDVVALAREAPHVLPEVPASVWSGISAELGRDVVPPHQAAASTGATARRGEEPPVAPSPGHSDVVQPQLDRRRTPVWGLALAAMAGAIVGGAVVSSAVDRGSSPSADPEVFVAQAALAPLTDVVTGDGEATVVDSADGKVVRVDARALPDNDGFYEVWLLNAGATRMVALGALPAGSVGTFTLPPGLSIEDFPVVDISLESYDGDPTHSTKSLMRGVLEA